MPGLALRTSLIVGLPGETEADFADLLAFVREQRFERLGVFEYSREEGTPAAELPDQVPEELKRERYQALMEAQQPISAAHQRALVGRRLEVLVEGASEESEHLLVGRHAQQAPEIDGLTYLNELELEPGALERSRGGSESGAAGASAGEAPAVSVYPGELVTVEVTDASAYDLVGKVVARDPVPRRTVKARPRPAAPRPGLKVIG